MACTKKCRECGEELPLEAYGTDGRSRDGKAVVCTQCKNLSFDRTRDKHILSTDELRAWWTFIITGDAALKDKIRSSELLARSLHIFDIPAGEPTDMQGIAIYKSMSTNELRTALQNLLDATDKTKVGE